MPVPVFLFTVFITLALVFCSIGVCGERIAGRLKAWHRRFQILLALLAVKTTLGGGRGRRV